MALSALGFLRSFSIGRQGHKVLVGAFFHSQTQQFSTFFATQSMSTFVNNSGTINNSLITNDQSKSKKQPIRHVQTKPAPQPVETFKASDVIIELLPEKDRAPKPDWNNLLFGHHCTDHMIKVHWNKVDGWGTPMIVPVQPFQLHPYSKVFHYAQELFEGLKAYRGKDNRIRLFRPDRNMDRMRKSAARLCLPDFDGEELIVLMKQLLMIESNWIPPYESGSSMYIRPTLMGIEPTLGVSPSNEAILFIVMGPTGPYFSNGGQLKPVSLMANPEYVRAWPGGSGDRKLGSNYAPTLMAQRKAAELGHQQVLWLYGSDHQLTEVGTMNIFILSKKNDGGLELATPPISNGLILPGITRQSLIELARTWKDIDVVERVITMNEIEQLVKEKRLIEMFGSGTACVVCPVGQIDFQGKLIPIPEPKLALKMYEELINIQYGIKNHPWSVLVG